MNYNIRIFGWLLLGVGSVLIFVGVMALFGLVHVQIDFFGINLDTMEERIAWIVSWFVIFVLGSLLVALTQPRE